MNEKKNEGTLLRMHAIVGGRTGFLASQSKNHRPGGVEK